MPTNKRKPTEKRDPKVPGLIIRKQPSGRTLYYAGYRRPKLDDRTGKYRNVSTRVALGRGDHMTLDEARKAANLALSAARQAVNQGLKGDRVKDHVARALLNIDRSVAEIEAEAEKQDKCPTLEAFIDETYGPSLQSRRKYAQNGREIKRLKFILGLFPEVGLLTAKVNKIDSGRIDDWLTKRLSAKSERTDKPPSSTTIQRDLAAISGVFRTAMKRKLISSNPVAEIEFKATTNPIVRYLCPEEEDRLLKAMKDREDIKRRKRKSSNEWARKRNANERPEFPEGQFVDYVRPLVLTALHTGCRRGELTSLRWKDVHLAKPDEKDGSNYIRIPANMTKNGKPHDVPLNDFAAKVLRVWRNQSPNKFKDNGIVFSGTNGKKVNNLRRAWKSVLVDAKIKDFRFHDLRHTFASRLVMNGEPLNTVRELLNHSDLQMTLRYAHLAPDHKRSSVDTLAKDKKWKI